MSVTSSPIALLERFKTPKVVKDVAEEPNTAVQWSLAQSLLWAAIAVPLLAMAALLIVTGFLPAVFVGLVLFAPALAPFLLVGLGILATAGLKDPEDHRLCAPNQACCCGRHEAGAEKRSAALT